MTLDKGLLTGCLGRGMDTRRKGRSQGESSRLGGCSLFSVQPLPPKGPVARRNNAGARNCSSVGRELAQQAWSGGSEVQGRSRLPETLSQKCREGQTSTDGHTIPIPQDKATSVIEKELWAWDGNAEGSSVSLGPDSMSASVSPLIRLVLLAGARFSTAYTLVMENHYTSCHCCRI